MPLRKRPTTRPTTRLVYPYTDFLARGTFGVKHETIAKIKVADIHPSIWSGATLKLTPAQIKEHQELAASIMTARLKELFPNQKRFARGSATKVEIEAEIVANQLADLADKARPAYIKTVLQAIKDNEIVFAKDPGYVYDALAAAKPNMSDFDSILKKMATRIRATQSRV